MEKPDTTGNERERGNELKCDHVLGIFNTQDRRSRRFNTKDRRSRRSNTKLKDRRSRLSNTKDREVANI